MRLSLRTKILGSFAFIVLLSLATAVGIGNRVNDIRYGRYISLQELNRARVMARVLGSWTADRIESRESGDEIATEHPLFMQMPPDLFQPRRDDGIVGGMMDRMRPGRARQWPEHPGRESLVITDMNGRVLLDTAGYDCDFLRPGQTEGAVVQYEGRDVGILYISSMIPGQPLPRESNYLRETGRVTWTITAAVFLLAMGLGLLLTTHVIRPVKILNRATTRVKAGDLTIRVPEIRKDELGELSRSFNDMTSSLESADAQRRRLIADSAHELRTPVSLIRTRIEMMEEGVYRMDSESLGILAEESDRLVKLVEELRVLADLESPETGSDKVMLEVPVLLDEVVGSFGPALSRRQLELSVDSPQELPALRADSLQLHRLLANLLRNAVRHAESRVRISAADVDGSIWLRVEDDGPGIPVDARERVFERYYRTDASRSRESGGSGLGLAICREIVRAHGGRIAAVDSETLGGASLEVLLPLG